jgi:exosome complex component RRP41
LKSVFESVIMLELYPKSQIDLQVFVLESDGSYKSAAFNAVSLALMNAGIAMKDFLVATNSGLINHVAVVDLIYQEEKKQNCEFVIVYYAKSKNLAYVSLNCNKINMKDFQNLMEMSQSSCESIC